MKKNNLSIAKNGVLSIVSVGLVKAVNLISIPVFTRLLSTNEYGEVDYFVTISSILTIVLGLQLHGTIARAKVDFKDCYNKYASSVIIKSLIWFLTVLLLVNGFHKVVCGVVGFSCVRLNVSLIYAYAMFLISFITTELNFDFRYYKSIFISLSNALLNLSLSIVLIFFRDSNKVVDSRIIGMTTPAVIIAICVCACILVRGKCYCDKQYDIYGLRLGIPLVFSDLSMLILSSFDKIMINRSFGNEKVGIYSFTYTMGLMSQVLFEGMNQFYVAWAFRKWGQAEIIPVKKFQRIYLPFFGLATIVMSLVSTLFIKYMGTTDYYEGNRFVGLIVYSVFLIMAYTIYVNVEFFYKSNISIMMGTTFAAIINIVLNELFLERYGYTFAALSTVMSYVFLLFFHFFIVVIILKKEMVDNCFVLLYTVFIGIICFLMNDNYERLAVKGFVAIIGIVVTLVLLGIELTKRDGVGRYNIKGKR